MTSLQYITYDFILLIHNHITYSAPPEIKHVGSDTHRVSVSEDRQPEKGWPLGEAHTAQCDAHTFNTNSFSLTSSINREICFNNIFS